MTKLLIKCLVFTLITVSATAVLAATIRNDSGPGREYTALFSDATSLNRGDDIRMAGVKIGSVTSVGLDRDSRAKVRFTVSDSVELTQGTVAELRFRNLVGQRYISMEPPKEPGQRLRPGSTFGLDETRPALDLTTLFNGFQPLLKLLDPKDVNNLSAQIIEVFQGESATVDGLLSSTASLTSTLADKDKVIGQLITSLSSVLGTINERSGQLDQTLITLRRLVGGLAQDRKVIGNTLEGLGGLTTSVADLLKEGRQPLSGSIDAVGKLSKNLAAGEPQLDRFFETLPTKLDRIGRLGSYGSWLNFYACSIEGTIPKPEGYFGELGKLPIAQRCQ